MLNKYHCALARGFLKVLRLFWINNICEKPSKVTAALKLLTCIREVTIRISSRAPDVLGIFLIFLNMLRQVPVPYLTQTATAYLRVTSKLFVTNHSNFYGYIGLTWSTAAVWAPRAFWTVVEKRKLLCPLGDSWPEPSSL